MPSSGIVHVSSRLRSHFFEGLTPRAREAILEAAIPRQYYAKSVITNDGHPADHLFLLTKGLARYFIITEAGRKLLFQWLGPGDLFGGRTILSSASSYLLSTETVMDTTVLVWERPKIRGLIERYPRLLENALIGASDFVDWYLKSHIGLACHTARQRVAQVLVTLGRTVGERVSHGIELHITNEDLANAANVTHFTASRLISEWQRDHALVKRRGNVLLLSPKRLYCS
jgi:CRP/FNR family transcriptional regulator, nitrogen oxide reductase regulator